MLALQVVMALEQGVVRRRHGLYLGLKGGVGGFEVRARRGGRLEQLRLKGVAFLPERGVLRQQRPNARLDSAFKQLDGGVEPLRGTLQRHFSPDSVKIFAESIGPWP